MFYKAKVLKTTLLVSLTLVLYSCNCDKAKTCNKKENIDNWKSIVDKRLPEYGHRNWIVIADAAYPKQSAAGIETVYTGAKQVEVLAHVLKRIKNANHIKPIVMFDSELKSVSEKNAPGVQAYQTELKNLLGESAYKVLPHEDIIRKLDEGSKLFNVLLLKTDMTIPYTSVFIELDCGYWSTKKEKELRDLINPTANE